jgi:hypothetical protein
MGDCVPNSSVVDTMGAMLVGDSVVNGVAVGATVLTTGERVGETVALLVVLSSLQ